MVYFNREGYFGAFFPIFLSHFIIPPLSILNAGLYYQDYSEGAIKFLQDWYSLFPPKFLSSKYVHSLLSDASDTSVGWKWNRLTYMFVHSDFRHIFSNLQGAFTFGYPLFQEGGPLLLYGTFILGGIAAIYPSPIHDKHNYRILRSIQQYCADSLPSPFKSVLPLRFQHTVNDIFSTIGTKIYSVVPRLCCGSSGGVSALAGFSFVLYIRDFVNDLKTEFTLSNGKLIRKNKVSILRVVSGCIYIAQAASLFYMDLETVLPYTGGTSAGDIIDYASSGAFGHIQGALFGVLAGITHLIVSPYVTM